MEPEQLFEFLEQWDRTTATSLSEMDDFEDHLERAAEILDRIAQTNPNDEGHLVPPAGMEAFVNFRGGFLFKSPEWERAHPTGATLYDVIPEWHHDDVERTFLFLRNNKNAGPQLIVCKSDQVATNSLLMIQKANAQESEQPNKFFVRWLVSAWSPRLESYFREQHNLTSAELSVFEQMVNGLSFRQIEDRFEKTRETVKTQSKSIYSKLGFAGREGAVRFALHLQLIMPPDVKRKSDLLANLETEILNVNGRKIGIVRKGMLSGRPFIFLHGIVSGYEFGEDFEEQLRQANLCAICIERPGYGRSDNPVSSDQILEEWLNLFPAILDSLRLEECCLVTHASGAIYAASTLHSFPDRVCRGIGISSGVPNFTGSVQKGLPVSHRFLHWCLRNSSVAINFYTKIYAEYLNKDANLEKLVLNNYSESAPDKLALDVGDNLQCAVAGYKLLERPKLKGMFGDIKAMWVNLKRWQTLLETNENTAHFHHIWGAEDPMIAHDDCKAYCDTYPFTSWSIIEGGGHLLQFTHAHQVVHKIELMVQNDQAWNQN
ncbi:alpha/beta fold hydrolase [Planktotalea sp.]|uniref:alpha/beta fold hydrolase n=1 Tax=Planktotalea sp. TaxID=2029877 RepID=UPI00329A039E